MTADDGTRYLDLVAGIAVVALGHLHPAPLAAAHAQLDALWHVSNLYWTEPMQALASRLSDRFGGAGVLLQFGREANGAALGRAQGDRPQRLRRAGLVPRADLRRARGPGSPRSGRLSSRCSASRSSSRATPLRWPQPSADTAASSSSRCSVRAASIRLPTFMQAAHIGGSARRRPAPRRVQTGVRRTGILRLGAGRREAGRRQSPRARERAAGRALLVGDDAPSGFVPGDHAPPSAATRSRALPPQSSTAPISCSPARGALGSSPPV